MIINAQAGGGEDFTVYDPSTVSESNFETRDVVFFTAVTEDTNMLRGEDQL